MSAHTCNEDEHYAEDCVACQTAYAKEEAYWRAWYHPNLRPLEPGEHQCGVRQYPPLD